MMRCYRHCWVWSGKQVSNFLTKDGEFYHGLYLVLICGHCKYMGKILCSWDPTHHPNMVQQSRNAFYNVHNSRGCPPRVAHHPKKKLEYIDDI
jgi:hypothetical protein